MNSILKSVSLQHPCREFKTFPLLSLRIVRALVCVALALGFGGCGNRDAVQVQLQARVPMDHAGPNLQITAQVAGLQNGLHYKWFSVAGGCYPQQSDQPTTLFKFADGTERDRVGVEVWHDGKVVGRSELDVRLDEIKASLTADQRTEQAQIEITSIPPSEPKGGPDTHADIAGKVSGKVGSGYSVVLYARASEVWYVQPTAYAAQDIHPDNTWTSWTHTGSSYAALLVRPGFEPVPRLDLLPQVGGYVVARAIVDGAKK
jgi:hypothetical protein